MEIKDIDKRAEDPSRPAAPEPERPDYAQGLRTMRRDDAAADFARGERTLPRDRDVGPDFARGERIRSRDPAIRPDFARGRRTRPVR